MTQFAPKELCEKLQAMGCKSESDFIWAPQKSPAGSIDYILIYRFGESSMTAALTQNDFTGATDQARQNAKIVWGESSYNGVKYLTDDNYSTDCMTNVESHRHAMIDSKDWVKYLEQTMKKGDE